MVFYFTYKVVLVELPIPIKFMISCILIFVKHCVNYEIIWLREHKMKGQVYLKVMIYEYLGTEIFIIVFFYHIVSFITLAFFYSFSVKLWSK